MQQRGVALLEIKTPLGRFVVTSDRLSSYERHVARVISAYRMMAGVSFVLLKESEVWLTAYAVPEAKCG